MKTTHTPGPWNAEKQTVYANGAEVCSTDNLAPATDAEAEANARLIAAAPELLATLEQAVSIMRHAGGFANTVEIADKAIAKAKGE